MKKLKIKEPHNHHFEYKSDISRIVRVFADRGYEISESDAVLAWELYSGCMAAGWMYLDSSDEDVFLNVFCYFEVVE